MKLTANQTEQATLAAMYRALDRKQPVTITYIKADGSATVRTIEIADCRTTKAGHVILRAADRETREMRSWRLDRITAYTTHRTAYLVPVPADEAPAPRPALSTPAALIAFEIGRDERPARRHLQPAA